MKKIFLFDMDGTLTEPRLPVSDKVLWELSQIRQRHPVALVTGSNLNKIKEQFGRYALQYFDYVFCENGLVAYKDEMLIGETDIRDYVDEKTLNQFVSYCLVYLGNLSIPVKRGTFIEFRKGMISICPIGRDCSYQERLSFVELDKSEKIRELMIERLILNCGWAGLQFSLGGQTSIDAFPVGFDKRYCLKYLNDYEKIYFFGDKTAEGENDYEIFKSGRVIGDTVIGPEDTIEKCLSILSSSKD